MMISMSYIRPSRSEFPFAHASQRKLGVACFIRDLSPLAPAVDWDSLVVSGSVQTPLPVP